MKHPYDTEELSKLSTDSPRADVAGKCAFRITYEHEIVKLPPRTREGTCIQACQKYLIWSLKRLLTNMAKGCFTCACWVAWSLGND